MRVLYLHQICPDPEELLALSLPEAAQVLLRHLASRKEADLESVGLRKASFFAGTLNPAFEYSRLNTSDGRFTTPITEQLTRAWQWLLDEGLLVPKPGGDSRDWVCISGEGRAVLREGAFDRYLHTDLLKKSTLHSALVETAFSLFALGQFDVAIFAAFRAVESSVRDACSFEPTDIGVPLMRKAFNPQQGPLRDVRLIVAKQDAMMQVFAGAMGLFKNPTSHRENAYNTPQQAVAFMHLADYLLKKVDELAELNGLTAHSHRGYPSLALLRPTARLIRSSIQAPRRTPTPPLGVVCTLYDR